MLRHVSVWIGTKMILTPAERSVLLRYPDFFATKVADEGAYYLVTLLLFIFG